MPPRPERLGHCEGPSLRPRDSGEEGLASPGPGGAPPPSLALAVFSGTGPPPPPLDETVAPSLPIDTLVGGGAGGFSGLRGRGSGVWGGEGGVTPTGHPTPSRRLTIGAPSNLDLKLQLMGPPLAPPLGTAHPGGGRQGKREGLDRRPSADVGVPRTPDPGTRVPLLRAQSDHGHVLPGRPSGPAWMLRQPLSPARAASLPRPPSGKGRSCCPVRPRPSQTLSRDPPVWGVWALPDQIGRASCRERV